MSEKFVESNRAEIVGKIVSGFTFDHEAYGESFFMVDVETARFSGIYDTIPVLVSERIADVNRDCNGHYVSITGQYRSYNRHEEQKSQLILFVFAKEINFVNEPEVSRKTNYIHLDGYVCKKPVYRKTPLGNREITDLMLAVNRRYGKTDYIPCICWGRNARYAEGFETGTHCAVWGRIQSREYIKKLSEDKTEARTAYEVSVDRLEFLDEINVPKNETAV